MRREYKILCGFLVNLLHDYQLNALAKGLQGSRTQLLGVLITDISNSFFADLAKGIEATARKHGYSIILWSGRIPHISGRSAFR